VRRVFVSLIFKQPRYSATVAAFESRGEIAKIYGKEVHQIFPPEGYEFTGEFRVGRVGDIYLTYDLSGPTGPLRQADPDYPENNRLILRKKDEKIGPFIPYNSNPEAAKEMIKPKTYTAAEVFERYGRDLLNMYGYFNSGTRNNLMDYPGFAFTGRFEHVAPKAWFLSYDGPKQNTAPVTLLGLWLTLTPTEEPLPRIVSYNLMDAAEFEEDEARYLPNEKGEMTVVDPKEVPAARYYERQEMTA
jgi:hypothetical protein